MSPESFYTQHPAGEEEYISPEKELSIIVEQQANYKGNWTVLLHERVKSPVTRQKFLDMKREFATEETRDKNTAMGKFEKHSDVYYAIILLTPDDVGFPGSDLKKKDEERKKRNHPQRRILFLAAIRTTISRLAK